MRDPKLNLDDMSLIRGTALLGYADLVTELGADADRLLRAAGVPAASIGNPEAYLGYRNVIRAVESAAKMTGTPDFGRLLARRQGIEILGPVGAAARTARTVAAALVAVSQYLVVYSPAIAITLETADDERFARMEFGILLDDLPDHRQTIELSLGVALRIFRLLAGPDFHPVTVHLPHDPLTSRREYVRYFGGRPRFAEPFAGFTVRSADMARPVFADGGVHAAVRAYLEPSPRRARRAQSRRCGHWFGICCPPVCSASDWWRRSSRCTRGRCSAAWRGSRARSRTSSMTCAGKGRATCYGIPTCR